MLKEDRYFGEIEVDQTISPITFKFSAGDDCQALFELDELGKEVYFLITKDRGSPGKRLSEFAIRGKASDGKTVSTQSARLTYWKHGSDGFRVGVKTRATTANVTLKKPVEAPILRKWLRSFKSFAPPQIQTPLGTLVITGEARNVKPDDVSGTIAVQSSVPVPHENWESDADKFIEHMRKGLTLAHGGMLQVARSDYISENEWRVTYYSGRGFRSELPVQHFLDQTPFIKALITCYQTKGELPDELWSALSWMQIESTFDEIRILSAMVALDSITKKFLNGSLRKQSFKDRLASLFDHFDIPDTDFDEQTLAELVKLRNDITHEGNISQGVDSWKYIILARELIARILLKEIGFSGRYCCYINGLEDRNFP